MSENERLWGFAAALAIAWPVLLLVGLGVCADIRLYDRCDDAGGVVVDASKCVTGVEVVEP